MGASTSYFTNETKDITITNNSATSPIINVAGFKNIVVYLPAGLNATSITIWAAKSDSDTFYAAYNGANALTTTVAASRSVRLDIEAFNAVRLVSNNGSSDAITFSLQAS